MTNIALISVILRLVAIWLFVSVLEFLSYGVGMMSQQPRFMVIVVLKLALAAFFFFAPVWTARKLVPARAEGGEPGTWTPELLQAVLFSAAGVWLLATGLSSGEFTGAIVYLLFDEASGTYISVWSIVIVLIRIVLGVWLLFGASGLVRLLGKTRRARFDNTLFEDEKP